MLKSRPTPPAAAPKLKEPVSDRLVSMREAMEYLDTKGIPCKCRSTFYRILDEFNIPYTDTNPNGKHRVRRFSVRSLQEFVKGKGLKP